FGSDYNEAHAWYQRVLALPVPTPARHGRAMALLGAGMAARSLTFLPESTRLLEQSIAGWQELNDPARLAETWMQLAFTLRLQGQAARACAIFEANEALFRQSATPWVLGSALTNWGNALIDTTGDAARAKALMEECIALGHEQNDLQILNVAFS